MGICIFAKDFPISMDMGAATFFNLRMEICYHCGIFKEEDLLASFSDVRENYYKNIHRALKEKRITKGTYNFLLAPDTAYRLNPNNCKDLLSDISDLTVPYKYGYVWTKYNRFEDFRQLLRYCIREKKCLIWR